MTTGPARSETSLELSLVYELNVKVTSVQNYDCELLQNFVKSNVEVTLLITCFLMVFIVCLFG